MVAKAIDDYFDERRIKAPFADADPSLILNIDFRDGEAAVTAAMTAAGGFILYGTGHIWDSVRGWNPNQQGGYSKNLWIPAGFASRADAFADDEATLWMEVERAAFSNTWLDDGTFFTDSEIGPSASCWDGSTVTAANHLYGDYTLTPQLGYAFRAVFSTNPNNIGLFYQCGNASGNPTGRTYLRMHDGVTDGVTATRAIGRAPDVSCFDSEYMSIQFTIKGKILRVYIDGHLARQFRMASTLSAQDFFYRTTIGSFYTTTYALNGYIRRCQISNKAAEIVRESPRLAFIGDSFVQRGAGLATPNDPDVDTATVAQIDAVQNVLFESSLETVVDVNQNPIIASIWRPWIHEMSRVAGNFGLPFQAYVSAAAGRGWADTAPIPTAFINAATAYDPEIMVATGSVNDVDGIVVPNYLDECKAKIDLLIGGSKNLRKFYFFETWPAWKGKTNHATQAYIDEWTRQRGLQATLDGYTVANASGNNVVVEFVSTYDKIGGDSYSANFNIGGSEYAPLWDALYTQSLTMTDLHPAQYGHDLMTAVYWDALKNDFLLPVTE